MFAPFARTSPEIIPCRYRRYRMAIPAAPRRPSLPPTDMPVLSQRAICRATLFPPRPLCAIVTPPLPYPSRLSLRTIARTSDFPFPSTSRSSYRVVRTKEKKKGRREKKKIFLTISRSRIAATIEFFVTLALSRDNGRRDGNQQVGRLHYVVFVALR